MNKIDVLNKGYVILHDVMGNDLTVANAARVSYNKKKEILDEKDERLIKFLAKNDHTSPFRHATLQFEVYAPLMVARQWFKYSVSSTHLDDMFGWNESSRRYITEEPVFYIPKKDEWRSKPENSKQGSGKLVHDDVGDFFTFKLIEYIKQGEWLYEHALENDICAEQARLFLPAYGLFVRWYWTASLQSVVHFLSQRLEHDAQKEIQEYAKAVYELSKEKFPLSIEQLLTNTN